MKTNIKEKTPVVFTHEGAQADKIGPEKALRRSVMACMLWEDEFYEGGMAIAERIKLLIPRCRPAFVAACAYSARTDMKLRHMPLLIVREMARTPGHKALVAKLLPDVVQRADEIAEFMAIYWKDGKEQSLSAQVKKGLAAAFAKFSAFDLAKYDRANAAVRLRDVAFLAHVKAGDDKERGRMYAQLLNKSFFPKATKASEFPVQKHYALAKAKVTGLATPDTWETNLSKGEDKKGTFERLMAEGKLGALAFLRNLRNMDQAGVDKALIRAYAGKVKTDRVLPFRFITAARIMPQYEDVLEPLMLACMERRAKLPGKTFLLVDVSGSMDQKLSQKSEVIRMDAAVGLAVLGREICEDVEVYSFSNHLQPIAPRRGFALSDAIKKSQPHSGTQLLGAIMELVQARMKPGDRLIVLTDEQAAALSPASRFGFDRMGYARSGYYGLPTVPEGSHYYMVNVASAQNGLGYTNNWVHLDGFSEAILDYVIASEDAEAESD